MKYIKNYDNFERINEEFDAIVAPILFLAVMSLIPLGLTGIKMFEQTLMFNKFYKKKRDERGKHLKEIVTVQYRIKVPLTDDGKEFKGDYSLKGWWNWLKYEFQGTKFKYQDVEKDLEFGVYQSKNENDKDPYYAINIKESFEDETPDYRTTVIVFNKKQFDEWKKSVTGKRLNYDPTEKLASGKSREAEGWLDTYNPLIPTGLKRQSTDKRGL